MLSIKLKAPHLQLPLLIALAVAACATMAELKPVDKERLEKGTQDTSGWYRYGGNAENWRYSPLQNINKDNVGKLTAAWIFQTGIPGQMTNSPIIADGVL